MMKLMILLFLVCSVFSCEKLKCSGLAVGCSLICSCDTPDCVATDECKECFGEMWDTCCDCFGLCDEKPIETNPNQAKPIEAKPIEAKPIQEKPIQAKPIQAKPIQTNPIGNNFLGNMQCYLYSPPGSGNYICSIQCPVGLAAWCMVCRNGQPMCVCQNTNPCDGI
jgi:hypothetical protein